MTPTAQPPAIVFHVDQPPDLLMGIDRAKLLLAIREVETGLAGHPRRPGGHGERGPYQFTRATWIRFSSRPFSDAYQAWPSFVAAYRYVDHIAAVLKAHGQPITVFHIAALWNFGEHHSANGPSDYGRRVSNLYNDLLTRH